MKQVLDILLAKNPDGLEAQVLMKHGAQFAGAVRPAQLEGLLPGEFYEIATFFQDKNKRLPIRIFFRGEDVVLVQVRAADEAKIETTGSGLIIPGIRGN